MSINRTEFTALLVPLNEVGRQIDDLRQLDPAAGFGLPAHVTVLYPFGPVDALDGSAISRLRGLFAAQQPFEVEFPSARWFGEDVLWLAPDDPRPFVAMTEAVVAAYPQWQPYGGTFATIVPHLTIGDNTDSAGRLASAAQLRAAEAAVLPRLPLRDSADSVLLMAGQRELNSWRVLQEFRLGQQGRELGGADDLDLQAVCEADLSFLAEMALLAAFPPGPLPEGARETPRVVRWTQNWGRPGDVGLVAWRSGRRVGAAWCRIQDEAFVGDGSGIALPEIAIAVLPEERSHRVGTSLLVALGPAATRAGHPILSLTVNALNPAYRLYERRGFVLVRREGDCLTMVSRTQPAEAKGIDEWR